MLSVSWRGVSQTTTFPDERCVEWLAPRPWVSLTSAVRSTVSALKVRVSATEHSSIARRHMARHGFMFCWYPLSLDPPLFVCGKSEFVSGCYGENVGGVCSAGVRPGPDPPIFRREDEIGFRAVDQVGHDRTVARAGNRGLGRGREIEPIEVAAEGIIEPIRCIQLKSRAGDKLELAPSTRGFHTSGSGKAGDRIRAGYNVLVGSSTQSPERSATISFAG